MGDQAMTTSEALHFLETLDFEGEDANKFYRYMLRLGDIRAITDAFQSPVLTPDPHTGLVLCGCGGTAHFWGSSGDESFYLVECEKCEIETIYYPPKRKRERHGTPPWATWMYK